MLKERKENKGVMFICILPWPASVKTFIAYKKDQQKYQTRSLEQTYFKDFCKEQFHLRNITEL